MALEPETPSLADDENPELRDFSRRFWWSLPLTVVVFVLAMGAMFVHAIAPGYGHARLDRIAADRAPVVLWAGWPFLLRWAQSIRNRNPNMWTLIGTGVLACVWLQRGRHRWRPHLFPASFREHGHVGGVLRSGSYHRLAHPARAVAGIARAFKDLGARSSRCSGLRQRPRRRVREDGSEEDIELSHSASRRSPARAPGRESAG
jgi:Cu+-exporting ATPase